MRSFAKFGRTRSPALALLLLASLFSSCTGASGESELGDGFETDAAAPMDGLTRDAEAEDALSPHDFWAPDRHDAPDRGGDAGPGGPDTQDGALWDAGDGGGLDGDGLDGGPETRDVGPCVPNCEGRSCGSDGCGGHCGRCGVTQVCEDRGRCVEVDGFLQCGHPYGSDGKVYGDTFGRTSRFERYSCLDQAFPGGDLVYAMRTTPSPMDRPCVWPGSYPCPEDYVLTTLVLKGDLDTEHCVSAEPWEAGQYDTSSLYFFVVDTPLGSVGHGFEARAVCGVDCAPDCDGKECGLDGCGGDCPGSCPDGELCNNEGLCVPCEPDCEGRVCGDDGCGGLCGDGCAAEESCWKGICLPAPPGPTQMRRGWAHDGELDTYYLFVFDYDTSGRLVKRENHWNEPPVASEWPYAYFQTFRYDEHGAIAEEEARIWGNGLVACGYYGTRTLFDTQYESDPAGEPVPVAQQIRFVESTNETDESWTFTHDAEGRMAGASVDGVFGAVAPDGAPDVIVSFAYDDAGRLSLLSVDGLVGLYPSCRSALPTGGPSGREAQSLYTGDYVPGVPGFWFEGAGEPDGLADETWRYEYDTVTGRVLTETNTRPNEVRVWNLEYDDQGRLFEAYYEDEGPLYPGTVHYIYLAW